MRGKPEIEKPPVIDPKKLLIHQVRTYQLITPLYGGGVEPNLPDPITTVRATEIRGHLRFWWRAVCGGRYDGDVNKLREAEEKLWGGPAEDGKPGPSEVNIRVIENQPGNSRRTLPYRTRDGEIQVNVGDPRSRWGYIAFPLRKSEGSVQENVSFKMEIVFPENCRQDIEQTLKAWELFGGIGARTRRGFGALRCTAIDGNEVDLKKKEHMENEIASLLKKCVGIWHKEIPHLSMESKWKTITRNDPIGSWEALMRSLKDFRQGFRNRANHGFGRSQWPEADEIRRITKRHSPHHEPKNPVDKFPRAQFGLPIIFVLNRMMKVLATRIKHN